MGLGGNPHGPRCARRAPSGGALTAADTPPGIFPTGPPAGDGPQQVNVGTGRDATIKEIAGFVAEAVGFDGETRWDTSKPDGTPQKLLDVTKLSEAGWSAKIGLREGIASTVEWYREHVDHLRE